MSEKLNLAQAIDPRYLINVNFDSLNYPSAENAFQASKQPILKRQQYQTMTPERAAYRGSFASGQHRPDEYQNMYQIQKRKFSKKPLRGMLKASGDTPLIFYNTRHETYWGVCTCRYCNGTGENNLGKILEQIRSEI